MADWSARFEDKSVLVSKGGCDFDTINELEPDNPAVAAEAPREHIPSLAEQLQAHKERDDLEQQLREKNRGPKALDEDEFAFLQAIQHEEHIKQDLKRRQEQDDADAFNRALKSRVRKIEDITPPLLNNNSSGGSIGMPLLSPRKSDENLVIAPSVFSKSEKESKFKLDGVLILKKKKKKKKDKKNKKSKKTKHKNNDIDTNETNDTNNNSENKEELSSPTIGAKRSEVSDRDDTAERPHKKRRLLNSNEKLSEWEIE